ncbi:uncharacterized protein G2W53_024916 [Senna tora]|uniref:Uncharacterized protein n=1 Tax=Senna tora TaxID=362788 RepID=A0A834TDX3_9FABA|nr:uncharacterized protein G2W53_024916 [Senna tora]
MEEAICYMLKVEAREPQGAIGRRIKA